MEDVPSAQPSPLGHFLNRDLTQLFQLPLPSTSPPHDDLDGGSSGSVVQANAGKIARIRSPRQSPRPLGQDLGALGAQALPDAMEVVEVSSQDELMPSPGGPAMPDLQPAINGVLNLDRNLRYTGTSPRIRC